MACRKIAVTPLLTKWSYWSSSLSHRYDLERMIYKQTISRSAIRFVSQIVPIIVKYHMNWLLGFAVDWVQLPPSRKRSLSEPKNPVMASWLGKAFHIIGLLVRGIRRLPIDSLTMGQQRGFVKICSLLTYWTNELPLMWYVMTLMWCHRIQGSFWCCINWAIQYAV